MLFGCRILGSSDLPSPGGVQNVRTVHMWILCSWKVPWLHDCDGYRWKVLCQCPPPPSPQPMGKPPFPGTTSISRQNREGGRTVFCFISVPTTQIDIGAASESFASEYYTVDLQRCAGVGWPSQNTGNLALNTGTGTGTGRIQVTYLWIR